jgi:hypothetical protein
MAWQSWYAPVGEARQRTRARGPAHAFPQPRSSTMTVGHLVERSVSCVPCGPSSDLPRNVISILFFGRSCQIDTMSALRPLHRITHWLLNWLNGIEIRFFRRLFDGRKIRSRRLWLRQLSGVLGSRLLGHTYLPSPTQADTASGGAFRLSEQRGLKSHGSYWRCSFSGPRSVLHSSTAHKTGIELVRRRSVPVTPPRAAPCLARLHGTRGEPPR